jgi:SLA1 homology domain 1, SHD1
MNKAAKSLSRLSRLLIVWLLFLPGVCRAIDPVRPGDKIEVYYLNKWLPGEVIEYKKGRALVRYTFVNEREGEFTLEQMRFPNSEGSWMVWSDQSGKFKINARLIERSETHVKLKKEDDSVISVPIASLSDSLKNKLARMAKVEKEFIDSSLVRVGDQVEWKSFNTWYPATVKKLLPGGAIVDYVDGKATKEHEAKYADMRYPNGEGPWADWSDVSGKHKIKARYISHDETHVELLREGGKIVRMERARLAEKIESELAKRPVITRRPKEVEFDLSSVSYQNLPSWMSFGTKLGQNDRGILNNIAARQATPLPNCEFEVTLDRGGQVGPAFLVQATKPLIGLVLTPPTNAPDEPVSIHWIDIDSQQLLPGPKFMYGEKVISYSADQQRLLTAEGFDLRGSATRFCTYRLPPGQSKATAEWRWSVPEVSFMSRGNHLNAAFVGENNVLIGYGGTVTLWNLADRRAEYVVPASESDFSLSPDQQFFFTNQFSHAVVIETRSGKEVANYSNVGSRFCADGKHVLSMGGFGGSLIPLDRSREAIEIYAGFNSRRSQAANPVLIGSNLIFNGNRLWDLNKKLLIWSYQIDGLNELLAESHGDQWLAMGSSKGSAGSTTLRVGITTVPGAKVLDSVENISQEQLYAIRPGVEVRIDGSVSDTRILNGLRNSIQKAGWRESQSAGLVIKAAAFRGPSETHTYSLSRFGRASSGPSEQTITAAPWKQSLSIEFAGTSIWSANSGGVSSFITASSDSSLEAEARKCELESFELFQTVQFPERVLSPKWANGFGTTKLDASGLKESLTR